ncbi:MAG: hypothetical protein C0593_10210 [Marinilabiliales bacterium]|nr:MAG: hypothetical protein C0593_10210 [Marinilabiliales bacterium]
MQLVVEDKEFTRSLRREQSLKNQLSSLYLIVKVQEYQIQANRSDTYCMNTLIWCMNYTFFLIKENLKIVKKVT